MRYAKRAIFVSNFVVNDSVVDTLDCSELQSIVPAKSPTKAMIVAAC